MLSIEKKIVGRFVFPYSICVYDSERGKRVLCATESEGKCISFDARTGEDAETVWEGPGGTMSIVPDGADAFYATQAFFKGMRGGGSFVVRAERRGDGTYGIEKCFDLPFLHRFTVINVLGEPWFVGGTIADWKDTKDDWSRPGHIWIGKMKDAAPAALPLPDGGIFKNHGMYTGPFDGRRNTVIVTGTEGAFAVLPPEAEGEDWQVKQILDREISDIRVYDLDGDGQEELVTIEGFHGDRMCIYKRIKPSGGNADRDPEEENGRSRYECVYSFPLAFGHPIWCGKMLGKPRILIGSKQANSGLYVLTPKEGAERLTMDVQMIDELEECSNIDVFDDEDTFYIYAACSAGNVVLYRAALPG